MPRDLYGPVVAGFHEGGRVEVEATPSRGQVRRGSGLSALPRVTAGSQHRSSTTPPTGPEWTAAEVSTKSARSSLGSFGAHEPKPLTCMFVSLARVCYRPPSQFENIWLRTKRKNAEGKVVGGSGGVCYLYFPARPSAVQRRALAEVGVR